MFLVLDNWFNVFHYCNNSLLFIVVIVIVHLRPISTCFNDGLYHYLLSSLVNITVSIDGVCPVK